jgi:aspartyl-tRNA(Asn)/glutamyl-tRNA(Gln) amidotransferase subunit B
MKLYPTIGLEIHVELNTLSKMFCSCFNREGEPNTNICPVCSGQPGTLPVINKEAVVKTLKTGLALNCMIPEKSKFDRKSYFYPDLPKGYQISQYDQPLCLGGYLRINNRDIKITRIHLEEDAGKLIHLKDYSLVDLNRAGVPLIELVTEPDIFSAQEARLFAEELRLILKHLDVSNADMEKGELRVDANVSLSKDKETLGTKVEIKNINSFKAIEKAINYEIERQSKILSEDKEVSQETRGWDEDKKKTLSQRGKEESHDYRYFPEPDLAEIVIDGKEFNLEEIKDSILETPSQKRIRFQEEYCLPEDKIEIFINDQELSNYYEKINSELKNWIKEADIKEEVHQEELALVSKISANYLLSDFKGLGSLKESKISPENFAEFIVLIYKKKISSKIAKELLKEMFFSGADPSNIIKDKKMAEISDESEIEVIIEKVVAENEKAVTDFKQGKNSSFQFLVGQIMKESKGKANPAIVGRILKEKIN